MLNKKVRKSIAVLTMLIMVLHILGIIPNFTPTEVSASTNNPVITVDTYTERGEISPYILGSNHRHGYNGFGMYDDINKRVMPDFLEKTKNAKLGHVRYPGGTMANLFKWKDTIGTYEQRRNVVLGNSYESVFPSYGVDEHIQYTKDIGAETIYMLGPSESLEDAADLIRYLNGIPGDSKSKDANGFDWAQLRADNGHPEPYGVVHFEIGNEMQLNNQRYWMRYPSVDPSLNNPQGGAANFAKRYALGDTVQTPIENVRPYGEWAYGIGNDSNNGASRNNNLSKGFANQEFYSLYYPVDENTETVYVNGEEWTKVSDFTTSSENDKVYMFDYKQGGITFGDGVKGMIPPTGNAITIKYQHTHPSFADYYNAMKEVDSSIKIHACMLGALDFLDFEKCDGVVEHPYIDSPNNLNTAENIHDSYMSIADRLLIQNADYDSIAKEKSKRNDFITAFTEFGTINIPSAYTGNSSVIERDEARNLSRGLSIASMLMGAANQEVDVYTHQGFTAYSFGGGPALPNAGQVYNALYAQELNDPTKTVESAMAMAYRMLGNGIADKVRTSWVENNPVIRNTTHNTINDYNAIRVLASQKDSNGDLYLLVLNLDNKNDLTTIINLQGYTATGIADISVMNAENIKANNTPARPNDVNITHQENVKLGESGSVFAYVFPKHSLTSIKLSKAEENNPYVDNFEKRNFEQNTIGQLPDYIAFTGAGTGRVITDPNDANNKVLEMSRTDGGNSNFTFALSGQNIAATDLTTYDGIVKISYRVKAASNIGRFNLALMCGTTRIANVAMEGRTGGTYFRNDNKNRMNYTAGEWNDVEIILNHKSRNYQIYIDGNYMYSRNIYNNQESTQLDKMLFELETAPENPNNGNFSFYIDDLSIQSIDTSFTPIELPKSTACDITTFTIPNQVGETVINQEDKTITINVPFGTNVTALTPTITTSEKATVNPATGTAQNFTNPVKYTVTAEDTTTTKEYTVTVTVLPSDEVPIQGVTLNRTTLTLNRGANSTLTATVNPTGATGVTRSWSSSRPSVATVDASGRVTAVARGTAVITFTAVGANNSSFTATCNVTVNQPATGVSVRNSTINLNVGKQTSVNASIAPSNANINTKITYRSENTKIATVSSSGRITGRRAGRTNIVITGGGKTVKVRVNVTSNVTKITFKKSSISSRSRTINLAKQIRTITPAASFRLSTKYTWVSSNRKNARVSSKGVVTRVRRNRTTTISVRHGKKLLGKIKIIFR